AVWFFTAQVSRYVIATYMVGALFGVLGWIYVRQTRSRNLRSLAAAAVAISILYGLWMITTDRAEDLHAAASPSYDVARWERETPLSASFEYINRDSSVKKVVIVNPNVAGYFVDKHYIKAFGRWGEQTISHATSAADVLAAL